MNLQLGVQPFWFWNGDMNDAEIKRQIDEMAAQKIPGFFIHPRQGLDIPYLSDTFFTKVKYAISCAKEHNMEVWLYDEYPYPSGTSGGKVMLEHPEYCCKSLEKTEYLASNEELVELHAPWGRLLYAKAFPYETGCCDWNNAIDLKSHIGTGYTKEIYQQSGLTIYNPKRFFRGDTSQFLYWTPPKGTWKIYIFTEVVMTNFKYFETYIDPLNPKAIQYFLETTHEKYKQHLGDEFGKTIKGIFTDEATAFPPERHWSPLLPDKITELHDLDIIDSLPALFEDMGPKTAAVRYAYWNAATEAFIDSYDKQIHNWCHENNLLYVGEKPIMRGKQLEHMDIAGIDACHQKVGSIANFPESRYRGNGKMVSSAAHFYNKPAALCEAFHSIGWGMTLQDMKWALDALAVCGIDWYIVHAFFYNTDGLRKHDSPASAFYQMPWWKDMHTISTYAKQLSDFQQGLTRKIPFLVVEPTTSTWTANAISAQKIKEDFAILQRHLLNHQIDYYIIDPALLATGILQTSSDSTSYCINDDCYKTIILPSMTNMEPDALHLLHDYAKAGGHLVSFGSLPSEDIGYGSPSSLIKEMFFTDTATNTHFFKELQELCLHLQQYGDLDWRISPSKGEDLHEIFTFMGTTTNDESAFFLTNCSQDARTLLIEHKEKSAFLFLNGLESRILYSLDEIEVPNDAVYNLSLDNTFDITLNNENALLLKDWTMTLPDGQSALVSAIPMADQLEESTLRLPVSQKNYFGCPKEFIMDKVSPTYHLTFYSDLPADNSPLYLVMEPNTFIDEWELFINEHKLTVKDFTQQTHYLPTNLSIDIRKYCCSGENTIRIALTTDIVFGGLRNPLYLMGAFSVTLHENSWKLIPTLKKGMIKNHLTFGAPFYSGSITYSTTLSDLSSDTTEIFISDIWLQDVVHLTLNDIHLGTCSFSPYRFAIPKEMNLKAKNTLDITIDTTLIGLFEGQYFNRKKHLYTDYI
jgi:hypothetical protein